MAVTYCFSRKLFNSQNKQLPLLDSLYHRLVLVDLALD